MALTPQSTTSPYCTVTDLFVYHDPDQVADMLRTGSAPRPSFAAMNDPTSAAGVLLNRFLLSGSGRVESTCAVANRYKPVDLAALIGSGTAGEQILIKLVADLCFWQLCQRRQPATADIKNTPGAAEAFEYLKQLANGDCIFGFVESGNAGLPTVQEAAPNQLLTPNVVTTAIRLFPNYGLNRLLGGGN